MAWDTDLVTRLQKLKRLEALLTSVKEKTERLGDGSFGWKVEDYPEIARALVRAMDDVPGKYREVK